MKNCVGEATEKQAHIYKWGINWNKSQRGKIGNSIFANLQTHAVFGLAIPSLGIYPRLI